VTPKALVRLYPRAWRQRYGDELTALVESTSVSSRLVVDLLRGAAREWLRELAQPRRLTPGRRLAMRHAAVTPCAAGLAIAHDRQPRPAHRPRTSN
jgi:hypothetical protein